MLLNICQSSLLSNPLNKLVPLCRLHLLDLDEKCVAGWMLLLYCAQLKEGGTWEPKNEGPFCLNKLLLILLIFRLLQSMQSAFSFVLLSHWSFMMTSLIYTSEGVVLYVLIYEPIIIFLSDCLQVYFHTNILCTSFRERLF